jgi:hypothetical protein
VDGGVVGAGCGAVGEGPGHEVGVDGICFDEVREGGFGREGVGLEPV